MLEMPSKNPPTFTWAPPAPSPGASRDLDDLPRISDRLVQPETREERIDGRRVLAVPSNPEHGDAHCRLDGEALFHIRTGYIASTDLLTRVSRGSDFATDTSIRKAGVDPATGDRYLEEVAFEVVHEQSERDVADRAGKLAARGIRRIFAIFVKRGEVAEWQPVERSWRPLPADSVIDDQCLIRPMPVRALLDRDEARDAVARVLVDEKNPVIEQLREEGFRTGHVEGRREGALEAQRSGIERLCRVLGIEMTGERQAELARASGAALEALAEAIERRRAWPA